MTVKIYSTAREITFPARKVSQRTFMSRFVKRRFRALYDICKYTSEKLGERDDGSEVSVICVLPDEEPGYEQILAGMASTSVRRSLTRTFQALFYLIDPHSLLVVPCSFLHYEDLDEQVLVAAQSTWSEVYGDAQLYLRAHSWLKDVAYSHARDDKRGRGPFSSHVFRPNGRYAQSRRELLTLLAVHPYRLALERLWQCAFVYQHEDVVGVTRPGGWNDAYRSFVSYTSQMRQWPHL